MNIKYITGSLLCMSCITYISAMEHSSEDGKPHKQIINSQRITVDMPCNKVDDLSDYAAYRGLLPTSKFKPLENNSAKSLFLSRNEKYVTTIDVTNTLSIQDMQTKNMLFSCKSYDDDISADSWSGNSQYLVLQKNGLNNTMSLYHPLTNKLLSLDHAKPVTSFEWSKGNSDYYFLAAGLQDGSIYIWNIEFKLCLVLPSPTKCAVKSVEWIHTKVDSDIIAFYENNTAYQWNMDSFFSFMRENMKKQSISSLLYCKLKRDFSYLAPHAIRLGVLVGTGYGLYHCIASAGAHHLKN